jgi:hypothetical protein
MIVDEVFEKTRIVHSNQFRKNPIRELLGFDCKNVKISRIISLLAANSR